MKYLKYFLLGILFFPIFSFADTIVSQLDYSTSETTVDSSFFQSIGSGYTSQAYSATFYLKSFDGAVSGLAKLQARLYECTDGTYSSCSIVASSSTDDVSVSPHFQTFIFSSSYLMINTKYYALHLFPQNDNSTQYAVPFGCVSSCFSSGSLLTGSTLLSDIFFSLEDIYGNDSDLSGNYFTNLSPYYSSTTLTNLVSLSFDFYNTGYAYPNWDKVCAYMLNIETGAFQTANEDIKCFNLVATGINSFATTTTLSEGLTQIILYQFDSASGERALATTSRFIVKQSFLNIQGVPQFEATTTILQDCSTYSWLTDSTKRLGCEITNGFTTTIRYMFYPSDSVLNNYKKLKDDYANKPPFGYVNAITSVFNSATTTATSTTETFFDTSYLSSIFTPLRVGLASILFLLFGVYIFKRFSNFQL